MNPYIDNDFIALNPVPREGEPNSDAKYDKPDEEKTKFETFREGNGRMGYDDMYKRMAEGDYS